MKRIVVIAEALPEWAAAVSAKENGIEQVMILERHAYLGGVLPPMYPYRFWYTDLWRRLYRRRICLAMERKS